MEGNTPGGVGTSGHCLVSANNQKCCKRARVPPVQSAVRSMEGESRRHRGLGTGSAVRHCLGFTLLLEHKYLEFMCDTPQRSAWILLASLPKFHFHPAILRGFQRPFVSLCHSPGKPPIWPWHGTGWSNPVVFTAWLWLFSETFGSIQMAFLCLTSWKIRKC